MKREASHTSIRSLAPGLLLAAPRVGDPNFLHTVVLLGLHEPEGAMGWVINGRSLGTLRSLLDGSNIPCGGELPAGRVFDRDAREGGPVEPFGGWLVYRRVAGAPLDGELAVGAEIGVTRHAGVLASLARGDGPTEVFMVLGYAGWGPDQLDAEVRAGDWLPAPVDPALVFDTAAEDLWSAAYERGLGARPGAFLNTTRGMA
jgi:putative transcriptional regulator